MGGFYQRKPDFGRLSKSGFAFDSEDEELSTSHVRRCGLVREPTTQIVLGAVLGVLLGLLLAHLDASEDVGSLVSVPGQLFLDVLKCLVLPMVFTSLATGVADVVLLGKVSAVGVRTAGLFVGLSLSAAVLALAVAMALRGLHPHVTRVAEATQPAFFHIQCENGLFLASNGSGVTTCEASAMGTNTTRFELVDSARVLLQDSTEAASVASQVVELLFQLAPSNIFESFQSGTLLSVITFAVAFGAAAVKASAHEKSPLLAVLQQLNRVFLRLITKCIAWSPLAVLSLVAGSLSGQQLLGEALANVGVMVFSQLVSVALFELAFLPLLLWLYLRKNPLHYMRAVLPAAVFALGCSSSLVTLPVTLQCVEASREVPRSLLHFVVTIGSTVHKNGSAIYFPTAMVFLVTTADTEVALGWPQLLLIVLVSLLGSMGVAPIPNSSLVMLYSIWTTVYPSVDIPASFSYLVAIGWLLGRIITACNVLGDTYVARMLAEQVENDEAFDITASNAQ